MFKNLKIVVITLYKYKLQKRLTAALCVKWKECRREYDVCFYFKIIKEANLHWGLELDYFITNI